MTEDYVSTLIMRTVILENGRCTEKYVKRDCPIEDLQKIEGVSI